MANKHVRGSFTGHPFASTSRQSAGLASQPDPLKPLPPGTSFLFSVEHISPDYQAEKRHANKAGHWQPPVKWTGIKPVAPPSTQGVQVYRWLDGVVQQFNQQTLPSHIRLNSHKDSCPQLYRCATVFTQKPETHHFLGVPFDARRFSVEATTVGRWIELGFDHDAHARNDEFVLSYLGCPGDRPYLATEGNTTWGQNLFPTMFRPDSDTAEYPASRNGGLTGELPLIFAVIAFSCASVQLHQVLTRCVRLRRWVPHNLQHGSERFPFTVFRNLLISQGSRERGVVVTVWLDPTGNTTADTLGDLEVGKYGAIFEP